MASDATWLWGVYTIELCRLTSFNIWQLLSPKTSKWPSRSLTVVPVDRGYTTCYNCCIVTVSLFCSWRYFFLLIFLPINDRMTVMIMMMMMMMTVQLNCCCLSVEQDTSNNWQCTTGTQQAEWLIYAWLHSAYHSNYSASVSTRLSPKDRGRCLKGFQTPCLFSPFSSGHKALPACHETPYP